MHTRHAKPVVEIVTFFANLSPGSMAWMVEWNFHGRSPCAWIEFRGRGTSSSTMPTSHVHDGEIILISTS